MTDHMTEAMRLLTTSPLTAEAQVHATLALVEQQRIANLIALVSGGDETAYLINGPGNLYNAAAWEPIYAEIRKGLGLGL